MPFMHVVLLAPFSTGPVRGNIITVNRIAHSLQLQGIQTSIIALDKLSPQEISQQLAQNPPDLLHAFHAFHSGPAARTLSQQLGRPYIITITGSDLFEPAFRDHSATMLALRDAQTITCFDTSVAELLTTTFTAISDKITVIPQGVAALPIGQPLHRTANSFIILLPAALRQAKGVLEAIEALTPLATEDARLQLWLAGGTLDAAYASLVRQRVSGLEWIKLLGEVPHEQMGALYAASDLVLNSSLFEGGMANSLLETMACAKPLIASDVPGNRSLIRQGETGFLFHDATDLRQQISILAQQPDQLKSVGQAARAYVLQNFSPEQEATSLIQLYQRLK